MTAITFPNSPSSGDTHTAGNGIVYTYDGEKWTSIGTNSAGTWTRSGTEVSLTNAGDDLNVDSGTLFVDASTDRVGVGNSSPRGIIHVGADLSSGATDAAAINLKQTSTTASTGIYLERSGERKGYSIYVGGAQDSLTFQRNNAGTKSDVMILTRDGNVGIGTTSPGQALDVNGNIHVGTNQRILCGPAGFEAGIKYASDGSFQIAARAGENITFTGGNDGTERARIDSSGRLLVGTTTEGNAIAATLTIAESGSSGMTIRSGTTSEGNIAFSDGTSGADEYRGLIRYDHSSNIMYFWTNAGERLRIYNNGAIRAPGVYNSTTTGGQAVYVESSGDLARFTSSIKYKTNVETLEDSYADAILNCRPVYYKSTCERDNKDWGWWGFIAEEVAEIDPRLVDWKTQEYIEGEDGQQTLVDLETPEPEGVRYAQFVPHLLNLIKRQQAAIETLEAKVAALEAS